MNRTFEPEVEDLSPRAAAADLQMHQLLAEVEAGERPPDLAAQILGAADADVVGSSSQGSRLLAVAMVVLGLGVAVGVAIGSRVDDASDAQSGEDAESRDETQREQDPDPITILQVANVGELDSVPVDTEAMTCFRLQDEDLKELGRFTKLRWLRLGPFPVSGGLKMSSFTSAGLVHLQGLTALERLDLSSTSKLDADALSQLQALPRLKWLSVGGAKLSAGSLAAIAKCKSLETLDLGHCENMVGAELRDIAAMPRLRELDLTGVEGLKAGELLLLKRAVGLRSLRLSEMITLEDDVVVGLAPLKKLRSLSIAHCLSLTDRSFQVFREMPFLAELDISNNGQFTDAILEALPKGLQSLRCAGCPMLTDELLKGLSALPMLREFSVHWSPHYYIDRDLYQGKCGFTAAGYVELLRTTTLTSLDLSLNGFLQKDDEWPELWAAIAKDQNLRELSLRGFSAVGDAQCRDLAAHPKLERLTLATTSVTDRGLEFLAEAKNRWKSLCLDAPMKISLEGLECFAGQPLEELSLYRLKFESEDARKLIRKLWPEIRSITLPDGSEI